MIGPCSIHDRDAALEYAGLLAIQRELYQDRLEIVMRTYFEKPRTVVGWKGLISDPALDGSYQVNRGIETARQLLLDINQLGLPTATEYLDVVVWRYIADLISWGRLVRERRKAKYTVKWRQRYLAQSDLKMVPTVMLPSLLMLFELLAIDIHFSHKINMGGWQFIRLRATLMVI